MDSECEDFDKFFRTQYPRLVKHLMTLGTGSEEAKDAASEAMIEAYRQWDTIDCPAAWVRVVARRTAAHNAERDREGLRRSVVSHLATVAGRALQEPAFLEEDQRTVLNLLASLPARQRTVMAWHLDGFTPEETARHLGMRPATVRSHLRHARRGLAEAAVEAGIYPPRPQEGSR
nr:sigma-70 family RNA polymerase sigma factor [Dactylosporangium thailandense]